MVYDYRHGSSGISNVRVPKNAALTIDPTAAGTNTAKDVNGWYDLTVYLIRAAGGAGNLVVDVETSRDGTNYHTVDTLTCAASANDVTTVSIGSAQYIQLNVTTQQAGSSATAFVMGNTVSGSLDGF